MTTEKRSVRIDKIFSDTDYIDWFCDFLLRHNCFSIDEWQGNSSEISELDKLNIRNLYLFFQGISNYANKHNIKFIKESDEIFFKIKYRGFYFKFGFKDPKGHDYLFCEEIIFDEEYTYIDLDDVLYTHKCKTIGGKKL